jgi:hypothetical protein
MMHRRDFVALSASGLVAAAVPVRVAAKAGSDTGAESAISALKALKQLEISGDSNGLQKAFLSDALRVDPSSIEPLVGRAAIIDSMKKSAAERKLLYFHFRQPEADSLGSSVVVVSNYEAGYDVGGQTIEETGKSSHVVIVHSGAPLIALEVLVPNLAAGGYGPLGTSMTGRHLGVFPSRALGPASGEAKGAGGGENDVLYGEVQKINKAWVSGNPADILKFANKSVFLIGDYSPFYVAGIDAVKEHFDEFYKTSKVNSLQSQDPVVRIWAGAAAVYFNFALNYNLGGKDRSSPGRAVYTFAQGGTSAGASRLKACAASHVVLRNIGDPYPTSA